MKKFSIHYEDATGDTSGKSVVSTLSKQFR